MAIQEMVVKRVGNTEDLSPLILPWSLCSIFSLELFSHPMLKIRPSQPIEGSSVTLTCRTQLPEQKPDVQLQFCFFRNGQALGSGYSGSSELQIPIIRREDSGSYWCKAKAMTHKVTKQSLKTEIHVQRIPVSDVSLETWPQGGQVMEGNKLVFICSVANATGDITYLWYRGTLGLNLETKTKSSLTAEFEINAVKESDAERYYCAADNGYGPILSELVSIIIRVPVSRPVLTFSTSGARAVVGDVVELHCEAFRGSLPIFYQFYHEDVTLGGSSDPSGGGASFNLSLTAEHSGNYSCEANNGQKAQHSEVVALTLTVRVEDTSSHLPWGVTEGLLSCLGCVTVALLFCSWLKKKIGRRSSDPRRRPTRPVFQESNYINLPDPGLLQSVYENVNVVSGNGVYSLVYHIQQEQEPAVAGNLRTHVENKVSSDIYSVPRKANIIDVDYEDTM